MFKNMKIGMRLAAGFALVLILLSAVAIIGVTRLSELNSVVDDMGKNKYPKTVIANEIRDNANVAARSLRNMLLEKDPAETEKQLTRIADARKNISERLEKLKATITTEKGKEKLKVIEDTRPAFFAAQNKVLDLIKEGKKDVAAEVVLGELSKTQNVYFEAIQGLIDFQDELMNKDITESAETYNSARNIMIILSIIAIVIGISVAFLATRSITRPINEAVDVANNLAEGNLNVKIVVDSKDETGMLLTAMQTMVAKLTEIISTVRSGADNLASASEEISATAQSLSQASSEQAASVEETSASIEQMTASINQNTENAKVTDGMASKAAKEANEGGQAVNSTVEAMKKIAGKIGIVDDIAYQTNLLALNAAIEAARAGEHGKGFAVVAAEVRKLAERSQVAAQEIGELAGSSVSLAEKAGKLLEEMVPSINKTSDLVQEIASASSEQSSGVAQINGAMGQMNQTTQQNASASEELAATAEEMSSQTEQLQSVMSFFKLDDAGAGAASVRHSAGPSRKQQSSPTPARASFKMSTGKGAVASAPNEQDFDRF